jgi:PKD repeat protein
MVACALAWSAAAPAQPLPAQALVEPASTGFSEPLPLMPAVMATRKHEWISLSPQPDLALTWHQIQAPGASFIKPHFSEFNLPMGVFVEVSNRDGSEAWRYGPGQSDPYTFDTELGDDGRRRFSALSITGDTAIVRLAGALARFNPAVHAVAIDGWLQGLADGDPAAPQSAKNGADGSRTENACGADERYGAACWADSYPWEYERSAAVAKLITSRGEVCTAWRVGADNHMFTAEHCLGAQSELSGAEIWFNYQAIACGSSQNTEAVKTTGGSLLDTDQSLDYALFTVSDFSAIAEFPAFGLDVDDKSVGEPLWIPQHGLGKPRQIALESDMNASGLCEIDAIGLDGYAAGSDIGYYCDTTTSSSGAPVVAYETGRVVALHHFGGCVNSGVDFSRIWPQVAGFFGGKVPNGNAGGGGQTPPNQAPQAEFSADCTELACSFDATGSSDADGELIDFSWQFGDGGSASGQTVEHTFSEEGTFTVTLTVADDGGASASDVQTVSLVLPNSEPIAKFSSQCTHNVCVFDGSGSLDEDGAVVAWSWSLGDGTFAGGASAQHEYAQAGAYTVTLTVTDDAGALDAASNTITLSLPNDSPVADFVFSCDHTDCTFDADASYDSDGELMAWSWTFGDGGQGSGKQVSHSYAAAGSYTVTLQVQDDDGAFGQHSRTVKAASGEPQSNAAPHADFSYQCDASGCVFDASASSDPDGTIAAYRWTLGDGNSGAGRTLEHSYADSGSFQVTLEVEDDGGLSGSRSRTVEFHTAVGTEQEITLSAHGTLHGARAVAELKWTGAEGDSVEIHRDGARLATTSNDGKFVDTLKSDRLKPAVYRVCLPGSGQCSNSVEVEFRF